jgi:hypothetical protein
MDKIRKTHLTCDVYEDYNNKHTFNRVADKITKYYRTTHNNNDITYYTILGELLWKHIDELEHAQQQEELNS